jgi:hypothetical protein
LKRKIALLAVTFAILMLVEVQAAETANANPFPISTMSIGSPQSYTTFIYQNTTIPLTIGLNLFKDDTSRAYPQITHVTYSLDNQENITISNIPQSGTEYAAKDIFGRVKGYYISLTVNAILRNLSDGQHTINAYSFDTSGGVMSDSVTFEVLTSYKIPEVILVSPLDQVYNTNEIPLTFIVHGDYEQLCYSIDYNVTIEGNTTISIAGLANGCHTITVYANTPGRYGGSNSTYFIVGINGSTADASPISTVEPTQSSQVNQLLQSDYDQAVLIAVAFVIIILAVVSSLVYFKKHRSRTTLVKKP